MTTTTTTYNGHIDWNHWNVSLWLNNDADLYRAALSCLRAAGGYRARAAMEMFYALTCEGIRTPKTPDGAPYSLSAIYHAMNGMMD